MIVHDCKTTRDEELGRGIVVSKDGDDARLELGDDGDVLGEDAHLSGGRGEDDLLDRGVGEDGLVRQSKVKEQAAGGHGNGLSGVATGGKN